MLLGACAWLVVDLAALKEAVSGYLPGPAVEAPAAPSGTPDQADSAEVRRIRDELAQRRVILIETLRPRLRRVKIARATWDVRLPRSGRPQS